MQDLTTKIFDFIPDIESNNCAEFKNKLTERIENNISLTLFRKAQQETLKDKDAFLSLYEIFDEKREEFLKNLPSDEKSDNYINTLLRDGIVKVESLMPREQLDKIREFQNVTHEAIHPYQYISGYVNLHAAFPDKDFFYKHWRQVVLAKDKKSGNPALTLTPSLPNDGQVRLQSKNFQGLHAPGAHEFIKNSILQKILSKYNSNLDNVNQIERSNLEWIYPSVINHNPWHRDLTIQSVKAMILLEDTDEYSAPMVYAKRSHRLDTKFDKKHHYDMFCLPVSNQYGDLKGSIKNKWPEYSPLRSHCGFINNENAPNDIHPKERQNGREITIAGSLYELFVATGKAGDVIFFDSCGLHSGCRAHDKARKNIVLTTGASPSPKSIFFNMLREGGV